MSTLTTKSIDEAMKELLDGPYGESLKRKYGESLKREYGHEAQRLERAAAAQLHPPVTLTERYAGATVDIPGGTIELGLQRNRGEPIALKRAEMKRIVAEEALVLNGDDINEDSAARLSDRLDARFSETWPDRAFWVEIWRAEERLTQVYHRWPLP